jgi:hypothetical protein
MFCIGNLTSSTVIILSLKSKMMPYFFMVLTPRMRSYCSLLLLSYSMISGSARYLFAIGIVKEVQLDFSLTFGLKHPIQSIPHTVEPAFLRREAAWVCPYLQRQGRHQNQSLIRPALVFVCSACYCVSTPHHSYYGGGLTLRWIFVREGTLFLKYSFLLI